jgi:hypothetical protein
MSSQLTSVGARVNWSANAKEASSDAERPAGEIVQKAGESRCRYAKRTQYRLMSGDTIGVSVRCRDGQQNQFFMYPGKCSFSSEDTALKGYLSLGEPG